MEPASGTPVFHRISLLSWEEKNVRFRSQRKREGDNGVEKVIDEKKIDSKQSSAKASMQVQLDVAQCVLQGLNLILMLAWLQTVLRSNFESVDYRVTRFSYCKQGCSAQSLRVSAGSKSQMVSVNQMVRTEKGPFRRMHAYLQDKQPLGQAKNKSDLASVREGDKRVGKVIAEKKIYSKQSSLQSILVTLDAWLKGGRGYSQSTSLILAVSS